MQTLAIPRGQTALAAGRATPEGDRIIVRAERDTPGYGICSIDFLEWAFRTDSYTFDVTFHDNGDWSYVSDTMLKVRGREELFRHVDQNRLRKVAEPRPNPSARVAAEGLTRTQAHGFSEDIGEPVELEA
jgi:hypothetical protein